MLERVQERGDDLPVASERREVLERQVDRPTDASGAAQRSQLVELALMACHDTERGRPR